MIVVFAVLPAAGSLCQRACVGHERQQTGPSDSAHCEHDGENDENRLTRGQRGDCATMLASEPAIIRDVGNAPLHGDGAVISLGSPLFRTLSFPAHAPIIAPPGGMRLACPRLPLRI
jgi:hypothetical protein